MAPSPEKPEKPEKQKPEQPAKPEKPSAPITEAMAKRIDNMTQRLVNAKESASKTADALGKDTALQNFVPLKLRDAIMAW